ncbi:MAG: FAD-dependent oxidoreductase [Kiritimatiellia bacterium]|nr:FAD-dependent oxidoreductase [Kiritimatiellia bacterium]
MSTPEQHGQRKAKPRIVVIGGVAAGPKAASRLIRLNPDAEVTIIEKGSLLSYAGCGLPYYVSGVVKEQKELMSTPAGVVRDPVFFSKVKNVHVRNATVALRIDREKKRVGVAPVGGAEPTEWLAYDKLLLCTGARPVKPPLPGVDKTGVYTLHEVEDAEGIKTALSETRAKDVVIVGGGLIGVEMTEALAGHGCRVTVVEKLDQILPMLDAHMARLVEKHMESKGVRVMTGAGVEAILGRADDDLRVGTVRTSVGTLPADMVILSIGVRPNTDLAQDAGLTICGRTRAIAVNGHMQTSDPDIYAAGDCVAVNHRMTGQPAFLPLGSTANKQGRVAANHICGIADAFPGVLGSAVCKVFDFCVARTGLTEREARAAGYDTEVTLTPAPDQAHFMPGARLLVLKLVADRATRRLLGAQAVGPGAGDKRIDVAAMALTAGMTVDQLAHADLCYAPPFSPAVDNILTAADVMRNKLDGLFTGVSAGTLQAELDSAPPPVLLDVRTPDEFKSMRLPGSLSIPLGALRSRLHEVPRDRPVVAFCKISLRGYEAARILKAAGYTDVRVLDGGLATWPYDLEK